MRGEVMIPKSGPILWVMAAFAAVDTFLATTGDLLPAIAFRVILGVSAAVQVAIGFVLAGRTMDASRVSLYMADDKTPIAGPATSDGFPTGQVLHHDVTVGELTPPPPKHEMA